METFDFNSPYLHGYVSWQGRRKVWKSGGDSIIWWERSVPLGSDRVNWSAKIWGMLWHPRHPQGRQDEMVVICIIFQIAGCPGIQISILFDDLFLWGGISWNFRAVLWWWIYYANPSEATNSNVSTVDTPMYQKQIFQCSICTGCSNSICAKKNAY